MTLRTRKISRLPIGRILRDVRNVLVRRNMLSTMAILLLTIAMCPVLYANYPRAADELFVVARDRWACVELQAIGSIGNICNQAEAEKRLRQACLLLEYAVEMDDQCTRAWHDLMVIFATETINDSGRELAAVSQYTQLNPDDNYAVEAWIKYELNKLNDRQSREDFLKSQTRNLGDYPHALSQVLTQLGILALERGHKFAIDNNDTDAAEVLFSQAFSAWPYNDQAYRHWLALPWQLLDSEKKEERQKELQMKLSIFPVLQWRFRLMNNPYDLQATRNLIAALEQCLAYEIAEIYRGHEQILLELLSQQESSKESSTEAPQNPDGEQPGDILSTTEESINNNIAATTDTQGQDTADEPNTITQEQEEIIATLKNILQANFDNHDLLLVKSPAESIRSSIKLDNDIIRYGDPIKAHLSIANIGQSILLLGPGKVVDPHVLIVAEISPVAKTPELQGYIWPDEADNKTVRIPLSHRYLLEKPALLPGQLTRVMEMLNIGQLRKILQGHPQQEYKISLEMILDPVPNGRGGYMPLLEAIQPKPIKLTREAFSPDKKRMAYYRRIMQNGTANKRLKAITLLAGLLQEARSARAGNLHYKPQPVDCREIQKLILHNLSHDDFRVRAYAARALNSFPSSTLKKNTQRLTKLLNDTHPIVRSISVEVLKNVADLSEYILFAKTNDESELVRRHMQLLSNEPWDVLAVPSPEEQQPAQDEQSKNTQQPDTTETPTTP